MPGNLVAIYRDPRSADAAVRDLLHIGIPRDRIHLSHRADPNTFERDGNIDRARVEEDRSAMTGAVIGGISGAVLFGFLTVILGFLPGMEWILWEGEVTTVVGAAAVGALLGVVAGGLGLSTRRPGGDPTLDERFPGRPEQTVLEVAGGHDADRLIGILSVHDPVSIDVLGPRPVEPVPYEAPVGRRGLLSDVELAERQTRDRDRDPIA